MNIISYSESLGLGVICLFSHFFPINVSMCCPHAFCVLQLHLLGWKIRFNIVRIWKKGWLGLHWITAKMYLNDKQVQWSMQMDCDNGGNSPSLA